MRRIWLCVAATIGLSAQQAYGDVLYATSFDQLSSDITFANSHPGSTIYLEPGTYSGGALPDISADLFIGLDPASGGQPGSAVLNTVPTGQKGLLTIPSGTSSVDLTVNGLTFENASISPAAGGNGAGIRDETSGAASLIISNSTFLNNQDGILTGDGGATQDQQLAITITDSVFANNGAADGFEHGIYASGQSLNVIGSLFCGTIGGHDIKSRAAVTTVTSSVLFDGAPDPADSICTTGSTSYALDAPNGGQVTISNDKFVQGGATENEAIVSYGEEGLLFATNSLNVSDSSLASSIAGVGIQELTNGAPSCATPVQLSNDTFSNTLLPVNPPSCASTIAAQPIDEPASWWLFASSFFALTLVLRRGFRNPLSTTQA